MCNFASLVIEAVVFWLPPLFFVSARILRILFVSLQKENGIMKTTSEYLQLLKQFKDSKAKSYGISKIGLFGSVARGEHKEGSDVDVIYEGEPNILLRSRMKRELESLFGCKVDLVRFRKQIKNTLFGESIDEDLILV